MNVLSLFGGIETGLIALKEMGIYPDNYYSSEIDKYAISVAKYNNPGIIHLGDIANYKEWNLPKIDLIFAGFPCQSFSFAGKQLDFEDPRGQLFFKAVEILWMIQDENPDVVFLFENVKMKKTIQDAISEILQVEPVLINSALVSAQNRNRLYWCNFEVDQPEDQNILLKDVILCNSNTLVQRGRGNNNGGLRTGKSPCMGSSSWVENVQVLTMDELKLSQKAIDYMNKTVKGGRNHWDFQHHSSTEDKKSSAVVANFFKGVPYNVLKDNGIVRKFDPVECERLQTLPDDCTKFGTMQIKGVSQTVKISNTQRYKMIGNGWTKDVIKHILKGYYEQRTGRDTDACGPA